MKRIAVLILLLASLGAVGQSFYRLSQPFPNTTMNVCPVPSGGNPCPSPVNIYQDQGLTQLISQPVNIGATGNIGFWVSSTTSQFTVQIHAPYNTEFIVGGGGGGSAAFSAITSGTNTSAAMVLGTGSSLAPTGTGTISANQVNGAVVPLSAAAIASNASQQFVAAVLSGNTSTLATTSGSLTAGNCPGFDASGNIKDSGAKCLLETGVVYATDFGVLATTKVVADATTTSGSSTITCPNSDCNFVAGDVGKIVWAMGPLTGLGTATLVCPQSTIATVNSAQSITVTAVNDCTANQTANAQLIWGPDDTTALTNAWTATKAACNTLMLPAGNMIVQTPQFNTGNVACGASEPYKIPDVMGPGNASAIQIIPSPTFNFTNCTGSGITACFFGVLFQVIQQVTINGTGYGPAGCGANILTENNGGIFFDMVLENWCGGTGSSSGMVLTGNEAEAIIGGTIGFGSVQCVVSGTQNQLFQWPCFGPANTTIGALHVQGPQFLSIGNDFSSFTVDSAGSMRSIADRDTTSSASMMNVSNGTLYLDNWAPRATHSGILTITSGGKVVASNTNFVNSNTAPLTGQWVQIDSTSSFVDNGGNTFPSIALSQNPTIVQSKNGGTTGGTTPYTLAFTSATCGNTACPGNLLQVWARWQPTTNTISGCTDTLGNTWVQNGSTLTSTSVNGAAFNLAMLTVTQNKPAGGADTISCSFSANNTFTQLAAMEWKQTSGYDTAVTTNSGSTTAVSGTQTSVTNNSITGFVIGNQTANVVSGTCSPVNPCSAWPLNSFASLALGGFFQIVPTAGATTSAGTQAAANDWVGFWFTLRPINAFPPLFGNSSATGTFQTAANWSTPAGAGAGQWGTSPSVGSCTGDSRNQQCTITVGSGTVGANPVLTITQPTTWVVPPMCSAGMIGGTAAFTNFTTGTVNTTSAAFTYNGTPAASSTIILKVSCSN